MRFFSLWISCAFLAGCSNGSVAVPINFQNSAGGQTSDLARRPAVTLAQQPRAAAYRSLYNFKFVFKGDSDGAVPVAGLTAFNGALYGTTETGGAHDLGTVFKIDTSGTESVLYTFQGGPDGRTPFASLLAANDTLYGATYGEPGRDRKGNVFEVNASGQESVVHDFKGPDGANPAAGLSVVGGTFYGTTEEGGDFTNCFLGCGTVFKVDPSGTERVLYNFSGSQSPPHDGAGPAAVLTEFNGDLYGTTTNGGTNSYGTIFKISSSGKYRLLYRFKGGSDGVGPQAGLIAVNGALYGTTLEGGSAGQWGTVFKVTTAGVESVIYRFRGAPDGWAPEAALLDVNGTLYGTTSAGGAYKNSPSGTVFALSTSGIERVLYSFKGQPDGGFPYGSLVDLDGTLYGTASGGGSFGAGTVFSLKP